MVCCTKSEMTEVTVHVHCILHYKLHTICMVRIYIYKVLQAMKTQRGVGEYSSTLSLTSALDGSGWSMPHSSNFTFG